MQQVFTGPPTTARELARALAMVNVASARTTDALGAVTVYVTPEDVELAGVLIEAVEQVDAALAPQRVLDVTTHLGAAVPTWN